MRYLKQSVQNVKRYYNCGIEQDLFCAISLSLIAKLKNEHIKNPMDKHNPMMIGFCGCISPSLTGLYLLFW